MTDDEPPTEADEAYARALAAEADIEAAELRSRCAWCGAKLPPGHTLEVCPTCEASAMADDKACDGDEIPW